MEEVAKTTLLARIRPSTTDASRGPADPPLSLPAGAPADARYLVAYYQGLLDDQVGDYGSALESLQQASALAERGGMDGCTWTPGRSGLASSRSSGARGGRDLFRLHAADPARIVRRAISERF